MAVGIPTTHASTNFRSRLEARWAAFFDLVGWDWIYEPIDADGYIPDFLITGQHPMFIEIGPCITLADYEAKAQKADKVSGQGHDLLILGVDPLPKAWSDISGNWHPVAGLMGQFYVDLGQGDPGFWWEAGAWHTCVPDCLHQCWDSACLRTLVETWEDAYGGTVSPPEFALHEHGHEHATGAHVRCGRTSVHHVQGSFASRPCGHHDGDHHLGHMPAATLERLWREAGNRVQWRPK